MPSIYLYIAEMHNFHLLMFLSGRIPTKNSIESKIENSFKVVLFKDSFKTSWK